MSVGLNCDALRHAVADRLSDPSFAALIFGTWAAWDADKRTPFALRLEGVKADLSRTFSTKPFSDTLKFTTYDWPANGAQLQDWAAVVTEGLLSGRGESSTLRVPQRLRPAAVQETIQQRIPGMRNNAETAAMFSDIILPFRLFVQSQVVAFALDEAAATASAANIQSEPRLAIESDPSGRRTAAAGTRQLTGAQRHSLQHMDGGEDELEKVEALRDRSDAAGLRKRRAALLKRQPNATTRYIDYIILYMEGDPDRVSDADFAASLEPLAAAGLSFAQHDLASLKCKLAVADLNAAVKATEGSPAFATYLLQQSASRNGCAFVNREVEAAELLGRAISLGNNDARITLGNLHVERMHLLLRAVVVQDPATLAVRAAAGSDKPAWSHALKYHSACALKAVGALNDGDASVWEPATHATVLQDAKEIQDDVARVRSAAKALEKKGAGNAIKPWMKQALDRDTALTKVMRWWRVLSFGAILFGVVLVYYLVSEKEEGTCASRRAKAEEAAMRQKRAERLAAQRGADAAKRTDATAGDL